MTSIMVHRIGSIYLLTRTHGMRERDACANNTLNQDYIRAYTDTEVWRWRKLQKVDSD